MIKSTKIQVDKGPTFKIRMGPGQGQDGSRTSPWKLVPKEQEPKREHNKMKKRKKLTKKKRILIRIRFLIRFFFMKFSNFFKVVLKI